jgi:hypothetical protein
MPRELFLEGAHDEHYEYGAADEGRLSLSRDGGSVDGNVILERAPCAPHVRVRVLHTSRETRGHAKVANAITRILGFPRECANFA